MRLRECAGGGYEAGSARRGARAPVAAGVVSKVAELGLL
jgi:hypothetical protein